MGRYRQSGPIRFGEVAEFFGQTTGTPYSISDFYKGGGIVPATGPNGGRAAVHSIAVADGASSSPNTGTNESFYISLAGTSGFSNTFPENPSFAGPFSVDASVDPAVFIGSVAFDDPPARYTLDSTTFNINAFSSNYTQPITFTRTRESNAFNLQDDEYFFNNSSTEWGGAIVEIGTTAAEMTTIAEYLGLTSLTTTDQRVSDRFFTISHGTGNVGYLTINYARISSRGNVQLTTSLQINDEISIGTPPTVGTSVTLQFDDNSARRNISVVGGRSIILNVLRTGSVTIINRSTPSVRVASSPTGFFLRSDEDITLSDITLNTTNGTGVAEVMIDIPTDSISENLVLTPDENGATELRDSLLSVASANSNITSNWTVTGHTSNHMVDQYVNPGYSVRSFRFPPNAYSMFIQTDDDLSQNSLFADAGNRFFYENTSVSDIQGIYETTGTITAETRLGDDGWTIDLNLITLITQIQLSNPRPASNLYSFSQTVTEETPVVQFTAQDQLDHTIMTAFTNNDGNITITPIYDADTDIITIAQSQLRLVDDGAAGTTSSEISLDFGTGIDPQLEMIILGGQDRQGIADVIASEVNMHPRLYSMSTPNAARIEDSRQRDRVLPIITVPVAGSSGLAASDFTVTQVQAGIPTALTTDYPTIEYSTGDIAATTMGWNFHSSIIGPMTTFSTWPTTGEVFLHVGLADVVLDDIEATLGLAEITQTMQDVTPDATLTFAFRSLDLVDATSTYQITGVRLVSTSTGTALGVRLDGTTGVQSIANTDPLFADEQVVGLNFFRRQMGPVNDTIPPEGLTGTSDYSTDQNLADGTIGFFDGGTSGANNIELTEWPTTGIIYLSCLLYTSPSPRDS